MSGIVGFSRVYILIDRVRGIIFKVGRVFRAKQKKNRRRRRS